METGRIKLCLINNFDGHLSTRGHMLSELDFGEVAFADGFNKSVFADVGSDITVPAGGYLRLLRSILVCTLQSKPLQSIITKKNIKHHRGSEYKTAITVSNRLKRVRWY